MDDILEKIKEGQLDLLTTCPNKADETGSIKFTHEEEKYKSIHFLDTLIIRRKKEDGSVQLLVFRKATLRD